MPSAYGVYPPVGLLAEERERSSDVHRHLGSKTKDRGHKGSHVKAKDSRC